ncbi:MAG: hypothetical protein J7M09_03375 [Deltaproteobacteria bacterium]|nr:hypothetical protein [Candidatus Tharpella sp.]
MRGFIMYDNGRLRTGRVSLLLFLSLLLGFGIIFSLQKPVDKAVVVVRHIFTATPEVKESPKKPAKASKKADPQPQPQPQPEPVKLTQTAPIQTAKSEKVKTETKKNRETAAEKPAQIAKKESSPMEKAAAEIKTQTETKDKSKPREKILQQKISAPAKIDAEEQVVDYQQDWQPSTASNPVKPAAVSLMSDAARQSLRENLSHFSVPQTTGKSENFPVVHINSSNKKKVRIKPEIKIKSKEVAKLSKLRDKTIKKFQKSIETQSITVEKDKYATLHRAWRAVGKGEQKNDQLIPLRIENLRSAYNFLQMKAVVIMDDERCIDLSDGSRIPAASLDRFSSTVIQVDDPWQKWGVELRRAGLRPGQSIEVRYYLYDFVKRSIYARVNQAYTWSLNRGILKSGTKPADVDVLGRAYVVKRSGGGSFGVFVPLSLATRDGRKIDIDPLCFSNAPDIAALHANGLI